MAKPREMSKHCGTGEGAGPEVLPGRGLSLALQLPEGCMPGPRTLLCGQESSPGPSCADRNPPQDHPSGCFAPNHQVPSAFQRGGFPLYQNLEQGEVGLRASQAVACRAARVSPRGRRLSPAGSQPAGLLRSHCAARVPAAGRELCSSWLLRELLRYSPW